LIVYRGSRTDSYTGEGHGWRITSKAILIVDHDTANVRTLMYATMNGAKLYSTSVITNLHIVTVSAANNRIQFALSRPPDECQTSTGTTSESVFVQGPASVLAVNTNQAISFPKTFSFLGHSLFHSTGSGEPVLHETRFVVSFDKAQTLPYNANGTGLDAAMENIIGTIESLGYSKTALGKGGQSHQSDEGSDFFSALLPADAP
jgi:hypothetical protein